MVENAAIFSVLYEKRPFSTIILYEKLNYFT